jgi:hypothetical protein
MLGRNHSIPQGFNENNDLYKFYEHASDRIDGRDSTSVFSAGRA